MLFLNRRTHDQELNLPRISHVDESAPSWMGDRYLPSVEMTEPETAMGRRTCANPQCVSSWTAPWRSRKRPIFEGQWACSGRCVLELVHTAMRRESSHGAAFEPVQHRHRVPLGLLLLAEGWITKTQLQRALEAQRERGGRIGELLVEECGVNAELITRGLGKQWSCPVLGSGGFLSKAMSLMAPKIFIRQSSLLPLRIAGSRLLYAGFEDRLDASAALALEKMTGLKVESGLMRTEEYHTVLDALLDAEAIETKEESLSNPDVLAARVTAVLEQKQPVGSKLVRFYRHYWLRLWLEPHTKRQLTSLPQSGEDMLDYVFTVDRLS